MISYKLTNNDISFVDNGSGLLTIETCDFPVTNAQMIPLVMFTPRKGRPYEPSNLIDWYFYFGPQLSNIEEQNLNLLATQLKALIGGRLGVTGVDLSETQIEIDPGSRTPVFTNFCWEIDCNQYTL